MGPTYALAHAVRPQIAVISIGRHNTFGHPAVTTIKTWRQVGAGVLRTDQCRAISFAIGSLPTTMLQCTSW
jgi:competence protein ComEC